MKIDKLNAKYHNKRTKTTRYRILRKIKKGAGFGGHDE